MQEIQPSDTKRSLIDPEQTSTDTYGRKTYSPPLLVGIGEVSALTRFDVSIIAG